MRNLSGRRRSESNNVQQVNKPRPGAYPLGSLQSRAAARALLDAEAKSSPASIFQLMIIEHIGPSDRPSTCTRSPSGGMDWIILRGDGPDRTEMEEWFRKVPKDGKRYKFIRGGDPVLYEPQEGDRNK